MTSYPGIFLIGIAILAGNCRNPASNNISAEQVQFQEETCNSPDAAISCCFEHAPDRLSGKMIIGSAVRGGTPLTITGRLLKPDGRTPYAGVLMYAYHTDSEGYYSKNGREEGVQRWHGRYHGWCKTGEDGSYVIRTIRPAPYPSLLFPAHIHAAIQLPDGSAPFYINDFVFSDDGLVDEEYRANVPYPYSGDGVIDLSLIDGIWTGQRDIVLK